MGISPEKRLTTSVRHWLRLTIIRLVPSMGGFLSSMGESWFFTGEFPGSMGESLGLMGESKNMIYCKKFINSGGLIIGVTKIKINYLFEIVI